MLRKQYTYYNPLIGVKGTPRCWATQICGNDIKLNVFNGAIHLIPNIVGANIVKLQTFTTTANVYKKLITDGALSCRKNVETFAKYFVMNDHLELAKAIIVGAEIQVLSAVRIVIAGAKRQPTNEKKTISLPIDNGCVCKTLLFL